MNVLVIGAHADDPEVSMGGTIAKLIEEGHKVKLLICILPEESREGNVMVDAKANRLKYQKASAKRLGCELKILDMNPYTISFNRELVKKIDSEIVAYKPDVIFTHWDNDTHQDHKAVALSTFAASRKNNVTVLMYEQLTLGGISPYTFSSHIYVDISKKIKEKIDAVKSYEFISKEDVDAITSLAKFRGNQIGVDYAECFQVCKVITEIGKNGFNLKGLWDEKKRRK